MNLNFLIFFSIFLTVYALLNYYAGLRIKQTLIYKFQGFNKTVYWIVYWFIALSYIVGRVASRWVSQDILANLLTFVGAYWLGAMYYFVLIFFIADIIGFILKRLNLIKEISLYRSYSGYMVFSSVLLIFIYGIWSANNVKITHYDITVKKAVYNMEQLQVVAVSDIHLGILVNEQKLDKLVNKIQTINPDVVLLAGDTIDEDIRPFAEQNMQDTFRKLKPKYGVYAVLGNHEYIGGNPEAAVHYLAEGGVRILRDEYLFIADSFYIVGRDDRSKNRFSSQPRKELGEILKSVNKDYPILLMDHQPYKLEDSAQAGVDMQVSGHTHNGQLFPNQYITQRLFELDWGYLKKSNLHAFVSSGYGTWGPPIKVGSPSEILDIVIHFEKP